MNRQLLEDVRSGFAKAQKSLPAMWFYDAEGSRLFEAITRLPEYYPTETERALLVQHAEAIVARMGTPAHITELGAGSAYKTQVLLEAFLNHQGKLGYTAIDVSEEALRLAESTVTGRYPAVAFTGIAARNRPGVRQLEWRLPEPRLILFLGSSIGNLEPEDAARWLSEITAPLRPQDALLLGVDREKDPQVLRAAYNDMEGTTARFNLNLLTRLNRELGATFDLASFEHDAFYNDRAHRIEMHLRSLEDQTVDIQGIGKVAFQAGETIHTENSYKYTEPMLARLLEGGGLLEETRYEDERGWFTLLLLRKKR